MKKMAVGIFLAISFWGFGCGTSTPAARLRPQSLSPSAPMRSVPLPTLRQDIRHVVAPGETIWRLSKMYDVPQTDILRANGLRSASSLSMGQSLLIPNASEIRPVISLYPNKKWKYIILHHSATDEGDSLTFNKHHNQRGFEGVGYHFIIDNGTNGKADGQIEVTPRWLKQINGAHCKAGDMNLKSIGICLVGNFNQERVSEAQMRSLVYLLKTLCPYYKISSHQIMGHGQVPGAATDCPGTRFPWQELRSRLASASS